VKTDKEGFIKDDITKVIINKNEHELERYKLQKEAILQRRRLEKRVEELEKRIVALEYKDSHLGPIGKNFLSVFTKINLLIDLANQYAVTVDLTANGSVSTGNGFVNGIFASNTFAANVIRGGNVQANGTLAIFANTWSLGNSTVNTVANSTQITALNITLGNTTVGFMANTTLIRLNSKTYSNLDPHVVVANNNVNIGDRPRVNFLQGGTTSIAVVDNVANNTVDITISSTGGSGNGVPSGSNTTVQFNDSGTFGGSSGFVFDKTTNNASLANTLTLNILNFGEGRMSQIYANSSVLTEIVLDSFFLADYRSAKYQLSIKDNTANAYQTTEILLIHAGGQAYMTEYATIFTNTDIASFTATVNTTHLILGYTGATNNTTVKGFRQAIAVSA